MMTEDFKKVAKIYLPKTAIPLDIKEYLYRGCKIWVFRRKIKKWRPVGYRKGEEAGKEPYFDEFWMAISDYFTRYSCEFEYSVEREIGESMSEEEARYRIENFINEDYAEYLLTEEIP